VALQNAGGPNAHGAVRGRRCGRLEYAMAVGRRHHDAAPTDPVGDLPGPAPQLCFAPSEVGRRMAEWGREEYGERCAAALSAFVEGSRSWLSIDHRVGAAGATSAWADVHDGVIGPDVGVVVLPNH